MEAATELAPLVHSVISRFRLQAEATCGCRTEFSCYILSVAGGGITSAGSILGASYSENECRTCETLWSDRICGRHCSSGHSFQTQQRGIRQKILTGNNGKRCLLHRLRQ